MPISSPRLSYLGAAGTTRHCDRALCTPQHVGTVAREISGHDLGDPDTVFNLQLALRVWRMLVPAGMRRPGRLLIHARGDATNRVADKGWQHRPTTVVEDVSARRVFPSLAVTALANVSNAFEPSDEGRLDPARHPLRAFDPSIDGDPRAGHDTR